MSLEAAIVQASGKATCKLCLERITRDQRAIHVTGYRTEASVHADREDCTKRKTIKIRPQRSLLSEAMEEVQEIEPTKKAVLKFLEVVYHGLWEPVTEADITVEKYGGIDERIGWDTYIVCVKGNACGFTNGPLRS